MQESDGGKEYAIAEVDSAKINIKLGIVEEDLACQMQKFYILTISTKYYGWKGSRWK